MRHGYTYRHVGQICNICWQTIYHFYEKIVKYDIYQQLFIIIVNEYITELGGPCDTLMTDTSLIQNKLGIDLVDITQQLKKHKTIKNIYSIW